MITASDPAFYNIPIRKGTAFRPGGHIGKEKLVYTPEKVLSSKSCL